MTSHERSGGLSPAERSRIELGATILHAIELEVLSRDQGNALGLHLNISNFYVSEAKRRQKKQTLWSIGEAVSLRELDPDGSRFVRGRKLGATGMLALAVGDRRQQSPPLQRPELLKTPVIDHLAERWPRVDRNVILDKTLEQDLDWLSKWTIPRGNLSER